MVPTLTPYVAGAISRAFRQFQVRSPHVNLEKPSACAGRLSACYRGMSALRGTCLVRRSSVEHSSFHPLRPQAPFREVGIVVVSGITKGP